MTNQFLFFLFSVAIVGTGSDFLNPETREPSRFQENRIISDPLEDFDALYESFFTRYGQQVKVYPISLDWSYSYEELSDSTVRVGRNPGHSFSLELIESRNENAIILNDLVIRYGLEKTLGDGLSIPPQGDNPEAFMVRLHGRG